MKRENPAFSARLGDRTVRFRRQSAAARLGHRRLACALMPRLGRLGLGGEEAYALAYNCVLLCQTLCGPNRPLTPAGVLRRFTLGEISALCRLYWEAGDEPFGDPRGEWDEAGEAGAFEGDAVC